jgi:hypothetical protein
LSTTPPCGMAAKAYRNHSPCSRCLDRGHWQPLMATAFRRHGSLIAAARIASSPSPSRAFPGGILRRWLWGLLGSPWVGAIGGHFAGSLLMCPCLGHFGGSAVTWYVWLHLRESLKYHTTFFQWRRACIFFLSLSIWWCCLYLKTNNMVSLYSPTMIVSRDVQCGHL